MSDYVFHTMSPEIHAMLALPPVPFPVRRSQEQQVFQESGVSMERLLFELHGFLQQHPELRTQYEETAGMLAYIVGVRMGSTDRTEEALSCLEIGLAYRPDNLSLVSNYAVALQSAGRNEDAVRQYERVIRAPGVQVTPVVWILAARLHAKAGRHGRARDLLRQCRAIGFDDPAFLRFLQEMEGKTGAPEDDAVGRADATTRCPRCGRPVQGSRRFCTGCGAPLRPQ